MLLKSDINMQLISWYLP